MNPGPAQIDHLVYAVPDLATAVERLDRDWGVRAAVGGSHPGWGTHNALFSLGPRTYLEILAPDPEVALPTAPRPCGLDRLSSPRLATWAAAGRDLDALAEAARSVGIELGAVERKSRRLPDGAEISWHMTDFLADRDDGILPFFVDWGESPHPAAAAPRLGFLEGLRAEHPDPRRVAARLVHLGWPLEVTHGPATRLVATIRTPRGPVELA